MKKLLVMMMGLMSLTAANAFSQNKTEPYQLPELRCSTQLCRMNSTI